MLENGSTPLRDRPAGDPVAAPWARSSTAASCIRPRSTCPPSGRKKVVHAHNEQARARRRRTLVLAVLLAVPGLAWLSLTHKPTFYRAMVAVPRGAREQGGQAVRAQSLQLRNDICNEPNWEAVFTDEEVNAWLAEDLVTTSPTSSRPRSTSRG